MRKLFLLLIVVVIPFCGCARVKKINLQPQKTGIATIRYYDEQRCRPLITEVWYPVDEQAPAEAVSGLWVRCAECRDAPFASQPKKHPLIIMSHGNGGDRLNAAWLAEVLAANGYIVAAMDHHGNTWNNKIAEYFVKVWERPQDVSFVIDQLLNDDRFASHINPEKIGFIGYSLGGLTGVWIAGGQISNFDKPSMKDVPVDQIPSFVTDEVINSIDFSPVQKSYRDSRVAAVFLMAPALGNLFDMTSLTSIDVPVYIVAPENDQIVPIETSAKVLAAKINKAFFSMIPGAATHYVFLNEATKGGRLMLDRSLSNDPPTVDRKQIHDEVANNAVKFFDKSLRN